MEITPTTRPPRPSLTGAATCSRAKSALAAPQQQQKQRRAEIRPAHRAAHARANCQLGTDAEMGHVGKPAAPRGTGSRRRSPQRTRRSAARCFPWRWSRGRFRRRRTPRSAARCRRRRCRPPRRTPPAAAAAPGKISRSGPSIEPSIDASCTMGPSRPIEPPEEMVTSDERLFTTVARMRMTPLPSTTASMKSADFPAVDQLLAEKQNRPRDHSARGGHQQPPPPRQRSWRQRPAERWCRAKGFAGDSSASRKATEENAPHKPTSTAQEIIRFPKIGRVPLSVIQTRRRRSWTTTRRRNGRAGVTEGRPDGGSVPGELLMGARHEHRWFDAERRCKIAGKTAGRVMMGPTEPMRPTATTCPPEGRADTTAARAEAWRSRGWR